MWVGGWAVRWAMKRAEDLVVRLVFETAVDWAGRLVVRWGGSLVAYWAVESAGRRV